MSCILKCDNLIRDIMLMYFQNDVRVIPYLSGNVESAPFRFKNSAKYKGVPPKSFWAFKSAPNFKNSVNVIRGLDQQLKEKNVTVTTTYGSF
jgi:hypothetical protein